jgi:RNA polymerase sigma-70 factor (ECF subfamily)
VSATPDLEPYRRELHAHLYRMLGSAHDAEDAVQETFLRAWRALDGVRARTPAVSQREALRALGDARVRELVERYTAALHAGNVDGMIALLAQDATWTMPPDGGVYAGLESVRLFLAAGPMTRAWLHAPARANGQIAVGCYMRWDDGAYRAHALDVLDLRGDRIAQVTAFLDPSCFGRFGLPPVMSP